MTPLTLHARLYLEAVKANEGTADEHVNLQALSRISSDVAISLHVFNQMVAVLALEGLLHKYNGDPVSITDAGRRALASHPFEEPRYLGKGGTSFVIRGDISRAEASLRLTRWDYFNTRQVRAHSIDEEHLTELFAVCFPAMPGSRAKWQFFATKDEADLSLPSATVWLFDEEVATKKREEKPKPKIYSLHASKQEQL